MNWFTAVIGILGWYILISSYGTGAVVMSVSFAVIMSLGSWTRHDLENSVWLGFISWIAVMLFAFLLAPENFVVYVIFAIFAWILGGILV